MTRWERSRRNRDVQGIARDRTQAGTWRLLGVWLALLAVIGSGSAQAGNIPFSQVQLIYEMNGEPLASFLERFFADEGLRVALSEAVRTQGGTLNGPRSGTAGQIFRSIADSNGLTAYFDGGVVWIYKRNEIQSRYFAVNVEQTQDFRRALAEMSLGDAYNSVRITEETGLVSVSGVPRFVDQVEQLATTVSQRRSPVETVFRFIPLKYAWATDRTFVVGTRQISVPGVASILRELLYDPAYQAALGTPNEIVLPASAGGLNGRGLASLGQRMQDRNVGLAVPDGSGGVRLLGDSRGTQAQAPALVSVPGGGGNARIVADPYRNAIIIRDDPERVQLYEDLIRALDIPMDIVEIEATIIDVNTQRLRNLGVDWRYGTGSTEAVWGEDGSKPDFLGALAADNIAALGQVPGFQVGAIIGNDNRFIARVNALEQEGAMRVVSRPQVVTLNDVEAVIENSRSVYVPVEGAFEVDLFNVYAGTVMRVTPHLIKERGREQIRMLVTIEDGDVTLTPSTADAGGEIPEVTRNAVTTQAIIDAGQSLLLGGLVREEANSSTRKVPLLGDIPLIGNLFRSRQRDAGRLERVFLISPRILDAGRPRSPVPSPSAPLPAPPDLPEGGHSQPELGFRPGGATLAPANDVLRAPPPSHPLPAAPPQSSLSAAPVPPPVPPGASSEPDSTAGTALPPPLPFEPPAAQTPAAPAPVPRSAPNDTINDEVLRAPAPAISLAAENASEPPAELVAPTVAQVAARVPTPLPQIPVEPAQTASAEVPAAEPIATADPARTAPAPAAPADLEGMPSELMQELMREPPNTVGAIAVLPRDQWPSEVRERERRASETQIHTATGQSGLASDAGEQMQ